MGAVADRLADVVIVTDDDPYTEPSAKIIAEIAEGVSRKIGENYWIVPNREDAIRTALAVSRSGDTIVLAGKGSETIQMTNR
ncbi:MAG TPA: hypothetical protein PK765_01805 [bacterium]|nr:hypothetical protein [bacterium]